MFRTNSQAALRRPINILIAAALALSASATARPAAAQGGFVESVDSTDVRSKLNPSHINSFVPSGRGSFSFPQPCSTCGVPITTDSDCRGRDCVNYVRYSYWHLGVPALTVPTQSAEVPRIQNVVWTNVLNVVTNGSSLMKSGGCNGCPDAGGISQQQIASGDGYVEFTVPENFSLRLAGLSTSNPGSDSTAIAFAIRTQQGIAEVREHGIYRRDVPLAAGDVFRIAVRGAVVTYARNGAIFYTSSAPPIYPLLFAATLYDLNTSLNNAVIAGNFANPLTS